MALPSEAATSRHRSVQDAARWLDPNPALSGTQREVAVAYADLAVHLMALVGLDDPELTRALVGLTASKDSAVRASIAADQAAATR
jgi:hypothetical protein